MTLLNKENGDPFDNNVVNCSTSMEHTIGFLVGNSNERHISVVSKDFSPILVKSLSFAIPPFVNGP